MFIVQVVVFVLGLMLSLISGIWGVSISAKFLLGVNPQLDLSEIASAALLFWIGTWIADQPLFVKDESAADE
jgi:hypothetical protein